VTYVSYDYDSKMWELEANIDRFDLDMVFSAEWGQREY